MTTREREHRELLVLRKFEIHVRKTYQIEAVCKQGTCRSCDLARALDRLRAEAPR